jgi:hypothetical protein
MDLAGNPGLRADLQAARAWGVSPSRFYGRQAVSVTTYEYDDARGRLVRSVTTSDPDWTDEDRELAWALQAYDSQSCPGCGGHLPDTTAPEREGAYATSSMLCHRCVAVEGEQHRYRKHPHPLALIVSAWPRPKAEEVPDGSGPAGDG